MKTKVVEQRWLKSFSNKYFSLEAKIEKDGHVIEGWLKDEEGNIYPIIEGVPCFLRGILRPKFRWFEEKYNLAPQSEVTDVNEQKKCSADEQALTNATFSDKWRRFKNYGLKDSHQEFLFNWYCKKLGLSNVNELKSFYQNMHLILEVGPGSGFNSRFMAQNSLGEVFSADISEAAYTVFENTKDLPNCHVIQADLMELPFENEYFDFIMADGVLHHTPDTKNAVFALYKKLKPGGQFFFYVYRKMGPAKQFCDQFIRERFSRLDPESCYRACEGITELGRELDRLNAKIVLEKGIPILNIQPGEHKLQRLFYYNFLKCFWNEAFDFETNNMVNFDWYHPHNAWQHTKEEVEGWLIELGVKEYKFNDANPNGISVLLKKI